MRPLLALFAPLVLLLSGCFDFTEEVWVERDHSARIAWTYGFDEHDLGPEQVVDLQRQLEDTARELGQREGVTRAASRYALRDGVHAFTLDVGVAHYRTLEGLLAEARRSMARRAGVASAEASPYRFEALDDGRVRWVRSLGAEGSAQRQMAAADRELRAKKEDAREHRMTFRFHAPRIDAAETATDLGKRSAEWSFSYTDEALPDALTAEFRFAPGLPWGLMLGLAGATAGFVWLRKKWHRRWE